MRIGLRENRADMAELADAPDLGSGGRPCRFKSCYPHEKGHPEDALFHADSDLEPAFQHLIELAPCYPFLRKKYTLYDNFVELRFYEARYQLSDFELPDLN